MKILMLSLLRLGDILMHRQVVQNLKRQYPNARIHMLIHSQFQSVQNLLPEVDQWHLLDRNQIQKILVERQQSPIAAFEKLQVLVGELNAERFDLVFNLTHNRFSVRLMDLIQSPDKRGVALNLGRKVADQNMWQTYLNENFSEIRGSRFHYLEVLQKSLGIQSSALPVGEKRSSPLILLQLLTSDVKKNWGLQRFAELKNRLQAQFPQAHILGICSPQEKDQVSKAFAWNEFLTPSLEEASALLNEAALLSTGDTSIQHLATQQGCPVVSLFLGSADPVKTAPWQQGAWVIQGQAACAPCAHSSPCHQSRHLCAESLQVETVFSLASGILNGEKVKVRGSEIRRTEEHKGSFRLHNENESFVQEIEQQVWLQYLNGSTELEIPAVHPHELEACLLQQTRFELKLKALAQGQAGLQEIETDFPQWKDSLLRMKRDLSSTTEAFELSRIRRKILNTIQHSMESEYVRTERPASEERFAEA